MEQCHAHMCAIIVDRTGINAAVASTSPVFVGRMRAQILVRFSRYFRQRKERKVTVFYCGDKSCDFRNLACLNVRYNTKQLNCGAIGTYSTLLASGFEVEYYMPHKPP